MPCLLFGEYTEVVCITYTMATRDLLDIYARALGPEQIFRGHGITITHTMYKNLADKPISNY